MGAKLINMNTGDIAILNKCHFFVGCITFDGCTRGDPYQLAVRIRFCSNYTIFCF